MLSDFVGVGCGCRWLTEPPLAQHVGSRGLAGHFSHSRGSVRRNFRLAEGGALNSAWIAVLGTLGGVTVTATAGLLTAMLTARQQRATLERQIQRETKDKLREERRVAFVDYLKAYDTAMGKAQGVMDSRDSTPSVQADLPRPFETVAETEMGYVNQAYLTITITASREQTREAAAESTSKLWRVGNAAMSGDKESYEREVEASREPWRRLRDEMRKELDVE
jgi:hypothetical protein